MPSELKERIEKYARKNSRSINSEIVGRLVSSVDATERPLCEYSDGELIKELMDRYERGAVSIRIGWPDQAEPEKK